MTDKELRELDAWIAEHVMHIPLFKEKEGGNNYWFCPTCQKPIPSEHVTFTEHHDERYGGCGVSVHENTYEYSPTTDPAAAMMVLEKCCQKETDGMDGIEIDYSKDHPLGEWQIGSVLNSNLHIESETLPLAICLFAKKLFSK